MDNCTANEDEVLRGMLSTPPKPHEPLSESTADTYSPEETDARREAILTRVLATSPKPKEAKPRKRTASQSK